MGDDYTDLDDKNFDKFIKGEKAVIDFWAEWCGPCRILEPNFAEVASEMKDKIKFGKVNIDNNESLSQRFQVRAVPTLIFLNDRQVVNKVSGARSVDDLKRAIEDSFK